MTHSLTDRTCINLSVFSQLWPRWQKEAAFWVIFVNAIIFAILPGPIIAPATFALAPILDVSLTEVAQLSGYQLLVVAALGYVND